MKSTAIWFLFIVWLSIEHGDDIAQLHQRVFIILAGFLGFVSDVRDFYR